MTLLKWLALVFAGLAIAAALDPFIGKREPLSVFQVAKVAVYVAMAIYYGFFAKPRQVFSGRDATSLRVRTDDKDPS
jgi:hypothetical protein